VDHIEVRVAPGKNAEANEQITSLLRQRHRIPDGADDDFNVRDMGQIGRDLFPEKSKR